MEHLYNLISGGEQKGPYTESQLRSMWNTGAVTADSQYAEEHSDNWHSLSELCEPLTSVSGAPAIASGAASQKLEEPGKRGFSWTPIVWAVLISVGIYLVYATDGCQHSPELPQFSRGSKETPISLRSSEIAKITAQASFFPRKFSADGRFTVNVYNGTGWTVTRLDVLISKNPKGGTPETRRFRLVSPETTSALDENTANVVEIKTIRLPSHIQRAFLRETLVIS